MRTSFAERHKLKSVVVVAAASGPELYTNLGQGAAKYLVEHAQRNFRVGLACANTIYHMVRSLPDFRVKLSAYPISFNLEPEMTNVLSAYATLIELWNRNPECTPFAVPIPPFYTSDSERRILESRPDARKILKQINDLNMGFYSCGYFGPGSSFDIHLKLINDYLAPDFALSDLEKLGAVGEINLNPFTLTGEQIGHPVTHSFEMLPLSRLRVLAAMPDRHMVMVAGGPHKVASILGALRGRYLNVLITDEQTLSAVVALDDSISEP